MSGQEKAIITALWTGRFFLSVHAARRMQQRSITKADIRGCGRTAESCIFQTGRGTYRVDGKAIEDEPLTVICGIDEGIVIVTLF